MGLVVYKFDYSVSPFREPTIETSPPYHSCAHQTDHTAPKIHVSLGAKSYVFCPGPAGAVRLLTAAEQEAL
jgi:hypothetical protein